MTIGTTQNANATALLGLQNNLQRLDQNAADIASISTSTGDAAGLTETLIEQIQIAQSAKANIRTIETQNDLLGTIIDLNV